VAHRIARFAGAHGGRGLAAITGGEQTVELIDEVFHG
jgi:hypothetical protein